MSERAVYPHPLLDARGEGVVITRSESARVALAPGRADFLVSARRAQRRPILVTGADAAVSEPLLRLLRETGGAWGVEGREGETWDGLTGRRLSLAEAASRRSPVGPEDLHPRFLEADSAPQSLRLRVSVARRHRDALETVIGGDIEALSVDLTGTAPAGWGMHEPAGIPWDKTAITAHARESGGTARYVVAGASADAPLIGQVAVHPTRKGVEELSDLVVSVGDEDAPETSARLQTAVRGLESVAAGVPLFAAVFAEPGRADLFRAARLPRPSWPVAILIGAPAMRAFELDADELAAAHGGRVLGKRRIPSLLLDFGALDPVTSWTRLRAFADAVGEERMTGASPALGRMLFGGGAR